MSIHPRRSLGARIDALTQCEHILTGAITSKSIRESERNELLTCLKQTREFLAECQGKEASIAIVLGRAN
jgi:hypothetical protein